MKIKSIVLIILLLFVCVSLFANEQSKALIAKAKQFEANKKYASALGTYFDAVIADDETYENYEEAYDAFQKLSDQIKSGQPGFGNYNEFTLYDNWVLLLKDAEAYWTTNCPYVFNFSELRKENVNFEKRTADYSCEIVCDYSEKYKTIVQNTILYGMKKVMSDSWGDLKEWPMKSAFTPKDGTPAQIYQKYGAAIVKYPSSNGHDIDLLDNSIKAQYVSSTTTDKLQEWDTLQKKEKDAFIAYFKAQSGIISISYCSTRVYYEFAPVSRLELKTKHREGEVTHRVKDGFVDIKLSLVDNSANQIISGGREFARIEENSIYTFKNIPANVAERIDRGDLSISISGLFVNYGDFNPSLYDTVTRKCVNNLPDVSLSVKQFENRKVSFDGLIMRKKAIEAFEAEKKG